MNTWFSAPDLWFPLVVMAGASFVAAGTTDLRVDPSTKAEEKSQFWRDPRLLGGAAAAVAAPFLPGRAGHYALLSSLGLLGSYVTTETVRLRTLPSHSTPSLGEPDEVSGYTLGR